MRARTLRLTEEQRCSLLSIRDRDKRAYLREQAAAILKIADEERSVEWVAHFGLLRVRDPATVRGWLNYYIAHGALHVRPATRGPFSPSGHPAKAAS